MCVGRSPHQSVVVEDDAPGDAAAVAFEQLLHGTAVAVPYLPAVERLFQLLKGPEEPKRGVGRHGCRCGSGEHAVVHVADLCVEGVDAIFLVVLRQRQSGQCDEHLPGRKTVPRVPGHDLGAVARTADDELPGRVLHAADEVDFVGAPGDGSLEDLLDGASRTHLVERRREDDAFALLELGLEITCGHQVLVPLVTAGDVLEVLEIVVPVGSGHEFRAGLAGLEVEPRETLVQTASDAVDGRVRVAVGRHVGLGQRVLVAESEERAQPQSGFRMGVDERVANHQLGALVDPQHLLFEDDPSDAVSDRGGGRVLEVGDVLVAARLVDALETVQRQVEALVVLHDRLVERREQYVGAVAVVDRCDHQTVVLARVAAYDRRAHVASAAIGSQHLA